MVTSHGARILAVIVLAAEVHHVVSSPQFPVNTKTVNGQSGLPTINLSPTIGRHLQPGAFPDYFPTPPSSGVGFKEPLGAQGQRPRNPQEPGSQSPQGNRPLEVSSNPGRVPQPTVFPNENPLNNSPLEPNQGRPRNPQLAGFPNPQGNRPLEPTASPERGFTQFQSPPGTQRPSEFPVPQEVSNGQRHHSCGKFPSPGVCQAAFPRYYYNASMSQCECYIFGGCDEAEGSYKTLEECHQKCRPAQREEGPSCRFVYIDNFHPVQPSTTQRLPSSSGSLPIPGGSSRPSSEAGNPNNSRPPPFNGNPNVDGTSQRFPSGNSRPIFTPSSDSGSSGHTGMFDSRPPGFGNPGPGIGNTNTNPAQGFQGFDPRAGIRPVGETGRFPAENEWRVLLPSQPGILIPVQVGGDQLNGFWIQ